MTSTVIWALRPEHRETARLPEARAELGGRWAARHGVAATVNTTGTPRPLRPEVEVTLLRAGHAGGPMLVEPERRHPNDPAAAVAAGYDQGLLTPGGR